MTLTAGTKAMRALFSELRKQIPKNLKLKDTVPAQYAIMMANQHRATDERLCMQRNELLFRCETFTTYLESNRKASRIQKEFHGKGERSIAEAANYVGLGLPETK